MFPDSPDNILFYYFYLPARYFLSLEREIGGKRGKRNIPRFFYPRCQRAPPLFPGSGVLSLFERLGMLSFARGLIAYLVYSINPTSDPWSLNIPTPYIPCPPPFHPYLYSSPSFLLPCAACPGLIVLFPHPSYLISIISLIFRTRLLLLGIWLGRHSRPTQYPCLAAQLLPSAEKAPTPVNRLGHSWPLLLLIPTHSLIIPPTPLSDFPLLLLCLGEVCGEPPLPIFCLEKHFPLLAGFALP